VKPYRDMSELVVHCRKDIDYAIEVVDRGRGIAVVAIHAGYIEPGVGDLAADIAGDEHSLYLFRGLREAESAKLRIPVTRFREMRLNTLLRRSQAALHIDAAPHDELAVHLGGSNRRLCALVAESLAGARIEVRPPRGRGAAHDPTRFYNAPENGGVHMAISQGLLRRLQGERLAGARLVDEEHHNHRDEESVGGQLVLAVRQALASYWAEIRSDLDLTLERFERATSQFPPSLRRPGHEQSRGNGHG